MWGLTNNRLTLRSYAMKTTRENTYALRTLMDRRFTYLGHLHLWRCVETEFERTTEQMRDAIVRYYSAAIQEVDEMFSDEESPRSVNGAAKDMVFELWALEDTVHSTPFLQKLVQEERVNELRPALSGATFLSDGVVENSALVPVDWFSLLSIVDEEEV